jgi:hypothetical protein
MMKDFRANILTTDGCFFTLTVEAAFHSVLGLNGLSAGTARNFELGFHIVNKYSIAHTTNVVYAHITPGLRVTYGVCAAEEACFAQTHVPMLL